MKKTFALVLAAAMAMSMAAVAFAAPVHAPTGDPKVKNNSDLSLVGPFKYDGDIDSGKGGVIEDRIQYGKAAYWQVLYGAAGSEAAVTEYKQVEKLKIKSKWEMGSDLVESLSIVKKRVAGEFDAGSRIYKKNGTVPAKGDKAAADFVKPADSDYAYFVELKTKAKDTTSDSDIVGTLTFNKKKSDDSKIEFDDADIDITLNVFFENNWQDATNLLVDSDVVDLKWEKKYLLKFDCDEEVEISFGTSNGGANEGTFTVDVSGQGKVVLEYDTKANDAIVTANPGAKLKFINFNNTKFNRTGEFAYEWEDGKYAYQLVDGKLTAIPGCEYDESDETFYFNTRVLGSYVFSDVELVDAAPAVTAPVEEKPANPTTGAAA